MAADNDELAGRIDGVARALMSLIADLEAREQLDGRRFCRTLRRTASARGRHAGLEVSAHVIAAIAGELDAARKTRRSMVKQT